MAESPSTRPIGFRAPAAPLDRRLAALLLGAAFCFVFVRLDARDLWAPDEPRYAQVAEEMRSFEHGAGGLVLPHLNGQPYDQKPPLYFWLAAAAGAPLGLVTEGAARLPSALAALATLALTIAFGARLLGGPAALNGAALLLTAWTFAETSRRVQLDVLLTFFETLALFGFWRLDRGLGGRRGNLVLLHASMGLAVLTKGPVGFLVPLLVMVGYLALERRLRDLPRALAPWALPLSLAPGLAWVASAAALAPSGYLDEAVGTNLIGRFFAGTSHERPFYYYLYQLPADFLPWSLFLPLVFVVARRHVFRPDTAPETRRAWRFLLAWVGASLVFFSISSGKRGVYMLPAFPAAALLCGAAIGLHLEGRKRLPAAYHVVAGVLAAALLAGGIWLAVSGRAGEMVVPRALGIALASAVAAAVVGWIALGRARVAPTAQLGVAVAFVAAVELAVLAFVMPALDREKSHAPIARAAAAITPPGQPVGLVSDEAFTGGLVYYGHRRVRMLESPEAIRAFFAEGGRAIVVKERKLGRVERALPVEVYFRARSGDRSVVVVTPATPGGVGAPEAPPAGGGRPGPRLP